jgi:ketosteroid isomerase-like protein
MNLKQRFQAYAEDFELSYADNDWSRVGVHFTEDAIYDAGDGSEIAQGRGAILLKLQSAVDVLDRQMDRRDLQIHRITNDGDTVTAEWTIRFTKADLPPLVVSGAEVVRYEGEAICELKSVIRPESLTEFGAWMERNWAKLQA